jgi:hypothetical protein
MIPMFGHQSRNINKLRLCELASYKGNMPVGVTNGRLAARITGFPEQISENYTIRQRFA